MLEAKNEVNTEDMADMMDNETGNVQHQKNNLKDLHRIQSWMMEKDGSSRGGEAPRVGERTQIEEHRTLPQKSPWKRKVGYVVMGPIRNDPWVSRKRKKI